mgnify:CR=1 FL=1
MNKQKQITLQTRIAERYARIVDNKDEFSRSINQPLKQSFRINSLKGDTEKILESLRKYDNSIKDFELGNHQQFLQSFINKKTNYKVIIGNLQVRNTLTNEERTLKPEIRIYDNQNQCFIINYL